MLIKSVAPATNLPTTYAYDSLHRLNGRTDPGPLSIRMNYSSIDLRFYLVNPDGGIATFFYDHDNRLTAVQDDAGYPTTYVLDAASRVTVIRPASGIRTTIAYDAVDQLLTSSGPKGILTYSYDAVGNRVGLVSPGALTTWSYDPRNRLTEENVSGSNAHDYTYTFDVTDNRLTSTETGALTQYTYDAANRIVTAVAGGLTTTYQYSAEGSLSQVVEPGVTYTYGQDVEFRLAYQTGAPGGTRTWLYDADGKLAAFSGPSPAGVVTVVWDGDDYLELRS